MGATKTVEIFSIHQCFTAREEIELYDITADYLMIFLMQRTEKKLMAIPKGKICIYKTSLPFIILHKYL